MVKWKECNNFLQVFSQNCGVICLFRRISVYTLSPVILLNSFLLSCVVCWDNLTIMSSFLFFFVLQVETAQMATVLFLLACSY